MTLDDFIVQHDSVAYCEIVISPNGDIEYAIPGHVYKLIDIAKESQDELNKIMPIVLLLLIGCVSILNTLYVGIIILFYLKIIPTYKCLL